MISVDAQQNVRVVLLWWALHSGRRERTHVHPISNFPSKKITSFHLLVRYTQPNYSLLKRDPCKGINRRRLRPGRNEGESQFPKWQYQSVWISDSLSNYAVVKKERNIGLATHYRFRAGRCKKTWEVKITNLFVIFLITPLLPGAEFISFGKLRNPLKWARNLSNKYLKN